ncbi:hypothetical protein ACI2K4_11560 [Micromonospora sp. NPDC050397]|uniref:hypothetical protein n=1 Tax=Micromonospora sp. NPDC050397 TaxID=3364279 RepID=UPI00385125CA
MKLVDLADGPLLETFHRELLATSFVPDQLVTLDDLREQLGAGTLVASVVVDGDGGLLAGLVGEWSPSTRLMLLSYLVVAPGARGTGIGGYLYAEVVEGWRSGYAPCAILAEVESPTHHTGSPAYGDPAARLRFYQRRGARLLDVPYLQPALAPGLARVDGLLLLALHVAPELYGPDGADTMASPPLHQFMVHYFLGTEGEIPDDPDGSALLAAMDVPGGVPLRPIEQYREVEARVRS